MLGGEGAANANLSARMVHAAVNSSEPVQVDYSKKSDGSVEVRLTIPEEVFEDHTPLEICSMDLEFAMPLALSQRNLPVKWLRSN